MPRSKTSVAGKSHQTNPHQPVLLSEVLAVLNPQAGESSLDVTAGYGGHAEAVLARTHQPKKAVLVDRDGEAEQFLRTKFGPAETKVIREDYLGASRKLAKAGKHFDMILADLGTSSPHLDNPERGFSFARRGPLDMRMDTSQELSAQAVVNNWPENKLEQIIRQFGEEPKAAAIAAAIAANRPISDTSQLAEVVSREAGKRLRNRKIHPATRTFQALRIAVNGELDQLRDSLPLWEELLSPGGRLAIISFHSLEDRIVKNYFSEHAQETYDSVLRTITKKPLVATKTKTTTNPRARSAKLRAAVKIKT